MCVSAVAIGVSPHWPLLIAGNRDEFFTRPTRALSTWQTPSGHDIWGGRDELDGGTWLAITPDAKACALVTNLRRGTPEKGLRSRGQLPLLWVQAVLSQRTDAFFAELPLSEYGSFNLICGEPASGRWWYLNNVDGNSPVAVKPGVYGLSNADLDAPWPKSLALKQQLSRALQEETTFENIVQSMQDSLRSVQTAPDDLLPSTGIDTPAERKLSSIFIDWYERAYGTRSSHVLALTADMKPRFWEGTYATQPLPARNRPVSDHSLL
jgi:uncharacterized protein with NRDE domain